MGILSFCSRIENLGSSLGFLLLFVTRNHDIFFVSRTRWKTMFDDLWGEVPRLFRKWEVPPLSAYFFTTFPDFFI